MESKKSDPSPIEDLAEASLNISEDSDVDED